MSGVGKRVRGTERQQAGAKQRTGRWLRVVDAVRVIVKAGPCGGERFFGEMETPAVAKLGSRVATAKENGYPSSHALKAAAPSRRRTCRRGDSRGCSCGRGVGRQVNPGMTDKVKIP